MRSDYCPTYSADGRRLRDHSITAVLKLESDGRLSVRRRSGAVLSARFVAQARNAQAAKQMPPAGQRYCFQENIGDTSRVWTHKVLPSRTLVDSDSRMEQAEINVHIAGIFAAVTLSVTVQSSSSHAPDRPNDKVICIDEFRNRRATIAAQKQTTKLAADPIELPRAA